MPTGGKADGLEARAADLTRVVLTEVTNTRVGHGGGGRGVTFGPFRRGN
jgi:hypothetical protein